MRITSEILKNFDQSAVEVTDCNGSTHRGWFIKIDGRYKLFPYDDIWSVYAYKVSHIKSIKHLTNDFEVKDNGK